MGTEKVQAPTEISCIVVPYSEGMLLLPNVSVAEIVSRSTITVVDGEDPWFLGHVAWRGLQIPAISYSRFGGEAESFNPDDARMAVINGISGNKFLPFFAVLVAGLPRLVRVTANILRDETFDEIMLHEYCKISLAGQLLTVPNLDYIEDQILNLKGALQLQTL